LIVILVAPRKPTREVDFCRLALAVAAFLPSPPSSHRRHIPALASKLPVARTLSPLLFGFQAQLRIERLCPPEMVDCCWKFCRE